MTPRVEMKARELIATMNLSNYDLAEKGYCHPRTALLALRKLHVKGECKIVAWRKKYYQWIPVYGIGQSDMKKPAPLTNCDRYRRYIREPENAWKALMRKRAQRMIAKVGK